MQDQHHYFEQLLQGFAAIKRLPEMQYEYNPRELVFQHEKVKLYHYRSNLKKSTVNPLLIVFATINRPEVLDLFPQTSFIGRLLQNGMDLYLLDWGFPTSDDEMLALYDYLTFLHACVKFIVKKNQQTKIDLLGICQGGVLSLCYAALFPQIKNLVLISTPIDFHTRDNLIAKLLGKMDCQFSGNVAGAWLTQFFISLRPFELLGKKYLRFIDNLADQSMTEKFLRVEKWLHDAPDQAGAAFKEFINDFYQQNKLIKGEITFQGRQVNLKKLTMPILNIMARKDEIIPISASQPLKKYVGSNDYSQKTFASGHISIYINQRITTRLAKTIAQWVIERSR